jgi:hypothetical protein
MRGVLIATCTLALAGGLAARAFGSTAAGRPGRPYVSVADCHPSDDVNERYATFNAQMRAIPGTARMAMRFTLLERLGGVQGFKPVSLSDLRAWRRSKPGARTFIYTQRVTALHDGGYYRMRVLFRWYGSNGSVLQTSARRSGSCHQPMPLPNLSVSAISAGPAPSPDQRTYSVTLTNSGAGEARDVDVALKVDGSVAQSSRVDLLPGDESMVVQIPGPSCALTVRAVADPYRVIRETDDSDNGLTLPCPQASSR